MTTRESLHDLLDEIPDDRLADAERELERLAQVERADVSLRLSVEELMAATRKARKGRTLDGTTIRELIEEGRT